MSGFLSREMLPDVFQIRDVMGVCMTLLVGEERALLVDTGYGLEDVSFYIKRRTDRPVDVLLTHAHHDHALGARWFERTRMFAADQEAFSFYTGEETRRRVMEQAQAKGLNVPDDFLTAKIPLPETAKEDTVRLGGMTAEIILCPGHTPGSAVIHVPERRLLLTGDNWNPCTWLFFPESLRVKAYRENMRRMMRLPFECVLCPHQERLRPREEIQAFFDGLTDEALLAAQPVDMGRDADTREIRPAPGQQMVFDFGKMDF